MDHLRLNFRPVSPFPAISPIPRPRPYPISRHPKPSPQSPPIPQPLAPKSPNLSPFALFFPYLRSFAGFLARRTVKFRSLLNGGLADGQGIDGERFVCCAGLGMMLMSTTASTKARVSPFLSTLAANPTFVAGVLAWAVAQNMKMVLHFFVERRWNFEMLFSSGGMPSSHSALCMALTTAVALCHGVGDSLFPVCLGFSLIVMYDAIGVRRHAGMQAEVLNRIIEDLFQGHPISERKLKELLGHTPSQVNKNEDCQPILKAKLVCDILVYKKDPNSSYRVWCVPCKP